MIIEYLSKKEYSIPKNIPITTKSKYAEVIEKRYAKYLDVIAMCGAFCMIDQFSRLIEAFNKDKEYTRNSVNRYSTVITKRLEELGFIGSGYLSKYKYIYLRQPAFALYEGDYLNHRRLNIKNDLKTDKFLNSIIKVEYLIDYDDYFHYKTLNKQLLDITSEVLKLITSSGNNYRFDTTTIKRIIELGEYDKIKKIINNTRENNTRLGIVRFIWGELGREYKKLGMQGQTISNEPFYLKLNLLEDGSITLHYVPIIIIFDTARDLEYYSSQSNKFFHSMFNLKGNTTHTIKETFINTKELGYSHFNRVGYTVRVIGSDKEFLEKKIGILNKPYHGNNEYSPLVDPCSYIPVDVNKYLKYSSKNYNKDDIFRSINGRIQELSVNKIDVNDIFKQ
ncbi:hypothetical protein NE686_17120 [Tissierella carlieri]|uniref:Uncharacterized protein n=1 Tax=Tissierella carlieri TaxID=689904 RepID=A0ABT1SEE9_9FIRM|nr:hypothetical protein [Tissierella carlieri]MCQ4924826.1 hypothetical protein [Tissierella carlieri]